MNQHDALGASERRLAMGAFAALILLISVALLSTVSLFVNSQQDHLVGHAAASAALTLVASGVMLVSRGRHLSLQALVLWGAGLTVAAEIAQGLAPVRSIEVGDMLAGLGGVLVAGLVIELLLTRVDVLRSLRTHTAVAAIVTLTLVSLLVVDVATDDDSGVDDVAAAVQVEPGVASTVQSVPKGGACPVTSIVGDGVRLIVGAAPDISGRCFETAGGGLGLFGPSTVDDLTSETGLLSSPLPELAQRIADAQTVTVRSEFVAPRSGDEADPRVGTVLRLASETSGIVLDVRVGADRIVVAGPATAERPALVISPGVTPGERHVIEVTLSSDTRTTKIDGKQVSSLFLTEGWADVFEISTSQDDLTLYVSNAPAGMSPFVGVVEWIEIEVETDS